MTIKYLYEKVNNFMSNNTTTTSSFHFHSIDFLRAIGAIAVCIFHFANGFLHEGNPIFTIFQHGHLGVEFFFVITGFLIPFSLYKKNYTIAGFGKYMTDRLVRIHPAYLGAVLICMLQELIPTFFPPPMYKPFSVTFMDVLGHFTYLQPLLGKPWLVLLFWTLSIQFQFYVAYGVLHQLFTHKNKIIRIALLGLCAALPFLIGKGNVNYGLGNVDLINFLPNYMHIFLAGILIFLRSQKLLSDWEYWVLLAIDCYLLFYWYGSMENWAGGDWYRPLAVFFASILIQFVAVEHQIFAFLGKISYSLYLIHLPIGWSFMSYMTTFLHIKSEIGLSLCLVLAVLFSIVAAYLYWKYVEDYFTNRLKKLA